MSKSFHIQNSSSVFLDDHSGCYFAGKRNLYDEFNWEKFPANEIHVVVLLGIKTSFFYPPSILTGHEKTIRRLSVLEIKSSLSDIF